MFHQIILFSYYYSIQLILRITSIAIIVQLLQLFNSIALVETAAVKYSQNDQNQLRTTVLIDPAPGSLVF